jgi:hypothetical protein
MEKRNTIYSTRKHHDLFMLSIVCLSLVPSETSISQRKPYWIPHI